MTYNFLIHTSHELMIHYVILQMFCFKWSAAKPTELSHNFHCYNDIKKQNELDYYKVAKE